MPKYRNGNGDQGPIVSGGVYSCCLSVQERSSDGKNLTVWKFALPRKACCKNLATTWKRSSFSFSTVEILKWSASLIAVAPAVLWNVLALCCDTIVPNCKETAQVNSMSSRQVLDSTKASCCNLGLLFCQASVGVCLFWAYSPVGRCSQEDRIRNVSLTESTLDLIFQKRIHVICWKPRNAY